MFGRVGSALLLALVGEIAVEVEVDHAADHVVPPARRDRTRDGEDAPKFIPLRVYVILKLDKKFKYNYTSY